MEEYQIIETSSNSCEHSNNYGLKMIHLYQWLLVIGEMNNYQYCY